jgi:hypothetical protein
MVGGLLPPYPDDLDGGKFAVAPHEMILVVGGLLPPY